MDFIKISTLQMGKQRHEETKKFVQGQKACK